MWHNLLFYWCISETEWNILRSWQYFCLNLSLSKDSTVLHSELTSADSASLSLSISAVFDVEQPGIVLTGYHPPQSVSFDILALCNPHSTGPLTLCQWSYVSALPAASLAPPGPFRQSSHTPLHPPTHSISLCFTFYLLHTHPCCIPLFFLFASLSQLLLFFSFYRFNLNFKCFSASFLTFLIGLVFIFSSAPRFYC